MRKLTKNQNRKKRVEAKRKAHLIREQKEALAWRKKWKQERETARTKIREAYRKDGMSEELIKRLLP